MPSAPIRRPSAHFTGPSVMRCPCGAPIPVPVAAAPLVCPLCRQRWQLRNELTELLVPPGFDPRPSSLAPVGRKPLRIDGPQGSRS